MAMQRRTIKKTGSKKASAKKVCTCGRISVSKNLLCNPKDLK